MSAAASLPLPTRPRPAATLAGPLPAPPVGLVVKPAAEQWVWHSRYGTIVIEVQGDKVYVNGEQVQRHAP
jgi:hypothetical protein